MAGRSPLQRLSAPPTGYRRAALVPGRGHGLGGTAPLTRRSRRRGRAVHDQPAPEVVFAFYRDQIDRAHAVLATTPLSAAPVGRHNREGADEVTDLRYIALHRIEETARHAGHLDAARELLGERTGLRPPLAPASFPGPGGVSGAPSPDLRRRRPEDGSEAQNRRGRAQLQSWGEQGGADRGVQRARRGLGRGHDDPAGLHGVLADFTECLPTLRVACARLRLNRATRSFRFPLTGQCDSGVSWDHPAGRPLRDLTIGVAGATPIVRSRTRHRLGQRLVWLRGELVWLRRQVLLDDPRQRACRWWPRGGCSADSWVSRCPASDSPAEPLTGGRPSAEPRDAGRTGAMCTSRL